MLFVCSYIRLPILQRLFREEVHSESFLRVKLQPFPLKIKKVLDIRDFNAWTLFVIYHKLWKFTFSNGTYKYYVVVIKLLILRIFNANLLVLHSLLFTSCHGESAYSWETFRHFLLRIMSRFFCIYIRYWCNSWLL